MTDNGTDPSPTPPARQQANRIRLAEDMRSGIYRQCEGGFYKLDDGPGGYSVCALGAAYEIARRWQLTDQKQPLKAISNWNAPVVPVVSDAYGFTFWQCVNLVLRNNHGANFEQLATYILKMPPAGSPGLATRLRNGLTRLWRNAGAGLVAARLRSADRSSMPAPASMPVDAARRRADLDARSPVPGGLAEPAPIVSDVR